MTYTDLWRPLTAVYDPREAQAVVRLLLERRYGLSFADVLCGRLPAGAAAEADLGRLQQRLLDGEPVQYVLGEAEFCGRWYGVAPGVLIPRPETEWLADQVAAARAELPSGSAILDMGTGSGCIACTVALSLASLPARVTAWDTSAAALTTARANAHRLGAAVTIAHQDMLAPPDDRAQWDIIVSNPPYVCQSEQAAMEAHVTRHEPHEALFVTDDDPLLYYRAISRYAARALKRGGRLLVETNSRYAADVGRLFAADGLCRVAVRQDFTDKDRYVTAYQP